MEAIVRDSLFGQLLNYTSKGKLFPHPEQKPGFVIPSQFLAGEKARLPSPSTHAGDASSSNLASHDDSASARTVSGDNAITSPQALGEKEAGVSAPVHPPTNLEVGKDMYLVDWYGDDPENPQYAYSTLHTIVLY